MSADAISASVPATWQPEATEIALPRVGATIQDPYGMRYRFEGPEQRRMIPFGRKRGIRVFTGRFVLVSCQTGKRRTCGLSTLRKLEVVR